MIFRKTKERKEIAAQAVIAERLYKKSEEKTAELLKEFMDKFKKTHWRVGDV